MKLENCWKFKFDKIECSIAIELFKKRLNNLVQYPGIEYSLYDNENKFMTVGIEQSKLISSIIRDVCVEIFEKNNICFEFGPDDCSVKHNIKCIKINGETVEDKEKISVLKTGYYNFFREIELYYETKLIDKIWYSNFYNHFKYID